MSQEINQKKIGETIKQTRIARGMTQADFAKALKTSQSAVARMENGKQNFTTLELAKIGEVLNRQIIEISDSMDFEINGGKKLRGIVTTNTSKNGSLAILFASLLNKGTTIIKDVPRIEEINRVVEFFSALGVSVKWVGDHDIEIKPPKKFLIQNLLNESAKKIRSSLWIIGPLIHYAHKFSLPNAGGCKMGKRTVSAFEFGLAEFGVRVDVKTNHYEISHKKLKPADIVMYEMSDGATVSMILSASLIQGKTIIRFASANYQVQEACFFLEKLGVKIEGVGTTTLIIHGVSEINQNIEYHISEDPTETTMFIAAAVVTKSTLTIKRCPIDFLALELLKLEKMGLPISRGKVYKAKNGKTNLIDIKIGQAKKLVALSDKIHAQPYPGINTDNLPFFATIAGFASGTTLIHDWMWENRAIYFMELTKLGFNMTLADPHRVYINGPTNLKPAEITCPPALRPATIILIAMLAAPGKSVLKNVYSIRRGYEEIADRLNKLGADIKVIKGI